MATHEHEPGGGTVHPYEQVRTVASSALHAVGKHRRRPIAEADNSAKQEWLQGVVNAWAVGRSI
jgi:hypothetical protein